MIDPISIRTVDAIEESTIALRMENVPECPIDDINNIYNIYDEKEFKKYINDIERCVRSSPEYTWCIQYIKEYMDGAESIFSDLAGTGDCKVKIEQHHTPFTLYDIVLIVFNKRMFYQEDISVHMVAKEVTRLHYRLIVGLVPLTKTEHKLVHNGYLFVPTTSVLGNYNTFIAEYKPFMLPEQVDIIERIEEATRYYNKEENTRLLEQRTIVIDNQLEEYKVPQLENVVGSMYNRIKEIKDNSYRLPVLEEQISGMEDIKLDNPFGYYTDDELHNPFGHYEDI